MLKNREPHGKDHFPYVTPHESSRLKRRTRSHTDIEPRWHDFFGTTRVPRYLLNACVIELTRRLITPPLSDPPHLAPTQRGRDQRTFLISCLFVFNADAARHIVSGQRTVVFPNPAFAVAD